jgi:hypothetical protein
MHPILAFFISICGLLLYYLNHTLGFSIQDSLGIIFLKIPIAIVLIVIATILISRFREQVKQSQLEADQRRLREKRERIEQEEREQARIRYIRDQEGQMKGILESSRTIVKAMPHLINDAERHLDKAEEEFFEGVFAPFWDQIEYAANKLAEYRQQLNQLDNLANDYRARATALPTAVSPFTMPSGKLPDARLTAARMAKIVRGAQKDFHFATIYEQRKTNKLLYEGFRSLGDAIYSLEDSISTSMKNLSDRLQMSVNDLVDESRKQADAMSRHNEQMKRHYENLANLAPENAKARSQHEKQSLRNQEEQKKMLDNIQRGRKPGL